MTTRVVIDPKVCGGRPIIPGTRIRVSDILDALAAGDGIDELLVDFPYLSREDINACLVYAVRAVGHPVVQADRARGGMLRQKDGVGDCKTYRISCPSGRARLLAKFLRFTLT